MSRWLKSVNTLLERLDGQAETAVEEHLVARAEVDDEHFSTDDDALDDILARRGLTETKVQEEEQIYSTELEQNVEEEKEATEQESVVASDDNLAESFDPSWHDAGSTSETETDTEKNDMKGESKDSDAVDHPVSESEPPEEKMEDVVLEESPQITNVGKVTGKKTRSPVSRDTESRHEPDDAPEKPQPVVLPKREDSVAKQEPSLLDLTSSTSATSFENEYKHALGETRQMQRENQTLRRHVVSLNAELESAESEIAAQRSELERAASRMERDRARQKEEKEKLSSRHNEEIKALKHQHDQMISDLKARYDQQLDGVRHRMKQVEERRMQEGGDWTKELEGAIQRDKESARRIAMLEDEKSTLVSQVSSLQSQQTALENRMASISQTADNAMEREREAEDRLDAALSMHARQLSQRQAREAELERTVADLGAALVVARSKEFNRLKGARDGDTAAGSGGNDVSSLRKRLDDSQDQIETLSAQLDLERQRAQMLHQELQDMSLERTEESSAAHARQLQNDRKIADLSVTVARLESNLRDAKKASLNERRDSVYSLGEEDKNMQIRTLSEQLLQQQETTGRCKSEISALRSRLQVALSRADRAEEALSSLQIADDVYDRMECTPVSGGSSTDGKQAMRRRAHGTSSDTYGGSIRSAIKLNPGQGDSGEKFGKAIDAVDSFSVQTGKYLRHNPLARAGFLLYLLLIHLWALAILVFHAHNYETVHGDFGAGHQLPHGPQALMQAHEPPPSNP